jgi:hypothetical protein
MRGSLASTPSMAWPTVGVGSAPGATRVIGSAAADVWRLAGLRTAAFLAGAFLAGAFLASPLRDATLVVILPAVFVGAGFFCLAFLALVLVVFLPLAPLVRAVLNAFLATFFFAFAIRILQTNVGRDWVFCPRRATISVAYAAGRLCYGLHLGHSQSREAV